MLCCKFVAHGSYYTVVYCIECESMLAWTRLPEVILEQAASWQTHLYLTRTVVWPYFPGGTNVTPFNTRSLSPPHSPSQMAYRLVQPFLHGWCCTILIHYIAPSHILTKQFANSYGESGPTSEMFPWTDPPPQRIHRVHARYRQTDLPTERMNTELDR